MKVFVGERPSLRIREFADLHGWGQMFIYEDPARYAGALWAFDNGAYLDWRNGREFETKRYIAALERAMAHATRPYMGIVPDLVGRGAESLSFSQFWRVRLPNVWPWYLALQDGMTQEMVRPVLWMFDGLFLGGTDEFKGYAEHWCEFAHDHGKRFHFGRAGTERKIKQALRIGADSIDSSFPLWSLGRLRRLEYLVNDWQETERVLNFG